MNSPEATGGPEQGGFFAPFRRIGKTLLAILDVRLQLFSVELQTERLRLVETLLKMAVAMAFTAVGLFIGALTLAVFVWELARFRGLIAMTALFLIAGIFLFWRIRNEVLRSPQPFAKTLEQLSKDRECFIPKD